MDFAALLAQHDNGTSSAADPATVASIEKSVSLLDGPLTTSRDGSGDGGASAVAATSTGRGGGGGSEVGIGNRQCYSCGEYDHISRDCPQGDRGGRGNHRGGGRGGGCGHAPKGPKVQELEPGVFRFNNIWGDYPAWDEHEWFSEEPGNILVTFEAQGKDNIVVALSPECQLTVPMYEIVIGGWKDTKTVIRREPQGMEKALSTEPRLCSSNSFMPYWVIAKQDGTISVGVGEKPGKGIILSWKDPEYIRPQWVSFTTWDNPATFRNVVVDVPTSDMEMEEVNVESFIPGYVAKLDEERAKLMDRAKRFDGKFVEPNPKELAEKVLSASEIAEMKRNQTNPRVATGFVTGFDITSEEEKQKAEERAKRFAVVLGDTDANAEGTEDETTLREKREARAKRFDIALVEDKTLGEGLLRDLTGLRVPRADSGADDLPRGEALNIYGAFDSIYTADILSWFSEYGASHVEWLHDCGANVVFSDPFSCKRALLGLSRELPPIEGFEEQVNDLKEKGYRCAPFSIDDENSAPAQMRFFLTRQAVVTDVKSINPEFRTTQGYIKRNVRPAGRSHAARQKAIVRARAFAAARGELSMDQEQQEEEKVTGKKSRRRDDDNDDDMGQNGAEEEDFSKRRRMKDDSDEDED